MQASTAKTLASRSSFHHCLVRKWKPSTTSTRLQLYTALIVSILSLTRRPGESIADLTQRCHQHRISQLQSKIRREKQFNRKVEPNQELQQQQRQLTRLQLS